MAGVRSNVDSIQDVSHVMEIVAKTIKEVVQYANLDKGRKILKQNRNMIAIIFCIFFPESYVRYRKPGVVSAGQRERARERMQEINSNDT